MPLKNVSGQSYKVKIRTFGSSLVLYVIDVFTLKKYPNEASIMVARQLKIVSQNDAFTISATRNIQYVFKKLACLIVFVKEIFDIYFNNIYHIVFSLQLFF